MNSEQFEQLYLHKRILDSLSKKGYREPTAIQSKTIPLLLQGKDLLATAQTGTGKTAAFSLPILHILNERAAEKKGHIRALVLTPTRELALQVDQSFRHYGCYLLSRTTVVLGGVSTKLQIKSLRRKPDILVATPGRLIDLIGQGYIKLDHVEMLVLDEADRMLDMGFIHDVRKIVSKTPRSRQTMLFSATLTPEIKRLASDMLNCPSTVSVTPPASVPDKIDQKVFFVEQTDKRKLLTDVLNDETVSRALVFARTKRHADNLVRQLLKNGIPADAIHSNKSQNTRQKALAAFDRGRIKVLVGTDIVSRGIDVDGISHVINYELPEDPESYVHRIGRTARAGTTGVALSFCNANEVSLLRSIEKLTKNTLTRFDDHPFHSSLIASFHERSVKASASPGRTKRNRKVRQQFRPGRRAIR
jgi:ATP-dependent RNA helicase RhlE